MNLCIYKSKKLRQKANILTVEQSKELAKLVGLKSVKNVTDQGIVKYLYYIVVTRLLWKLRLS